MELSDEQILQLADNLNETNKRLITFARAIATEQRKIDAEICMWAWNRYENKCAEAILKKGES